MNISEVNTKDIDSLEGRYINNAYLLCCAITTESHPQILPIALVQNGFFSSFEKTIIAYGARFKENRDDSDSIFMPLNSRFLENELFTLTRFDHNNKTDARESYFSYGNYTNYIEQELLEIYDGEFNLLQDFFIPTHIEIFELLAEKFENGARNYFYIRSQNILYGPFITNSVSSNHIKLSPVYGNNDIIYKWTETDSYDSLILAFPYITSSGQTITRSITSGWLPQDSFSEEIRFLSDDQLIGWIKKKVMGFLNFSKSDYNKFKEIYQTFQDLEINSDEASLHTRSLKLLKQGEENKHLAEEFLDILPQTKEIITEIEKIEIEKNMLADEKNKLFKEKEVLLIEIDSKQNERQEMVGQIRDLQTKHDETIAQQISEAKSKNAELITLIDKNGTLEEELSKIKNIIDYKDLEKEIEVKRAEINVLRRDENELNNTIKALTQEFIGTQKEAHEKLQDLVKSKTHFDFISGRDFTNIDDNNNISFLPSTVEHFMKINLQNTSFISHEKYLIDEIRKYLKANYRVYTNEFIANILISIFQNMITIFAGLPGTGKTSLARILSNALVSNKKKRVEIPVAKGWSSQKDFIGFYNPLSKKFSPTNNEMYGLLKISEHEVKDKIYLDSNIGMVILDEANLSPIEHYWSSFYNLTDSIADESSALALNIGTDEPILFANNIRFIGTINTDQTTEELSPRIIDRTNIIRIPVNDEDIVYNLSNDLNKIKSLGFTFSDAITLFNLRDFGHGHNSADLEKESFVMIRDEYKKIKEIMRKLQISISPRTDNSFTEYCLTAMKFMSQYKALDFFVSQRLLTKIDGQGENYGKDLQEFKIELESIFSGKRIDSVSVKLLIKIINTGSQEDYYHNYNYFLAN